MGSRLVDLAEKLERGEIKVSDIDTESEIVALAMRTVLAGETYKEEVFSMAQSRPTSPIDRLSTAQRETVIQGMASFLRGSPNLIPEVERFLADKTAGNEEDEGGTDDSATV